MYSENKGTDQLRSYCAFVFAFAKIRFSHEIVKFVKEEEKY